MYKINSNIFYKSNHSNVGCSKVNKDEQNNNLFTINKSNELNIMVIDDFYEHPMDVRNFALSQDINIYGHFPGYRTIPYSNSILKDGIQEIMKSFGTVDNCHMHIDSKCISKDNCPCYSGSFYINTSKSVVPWIHTDNNKYVAVIYLTPDAPVDSGTIIHDTIPLSNLPKIYCDKTKWVANDILGNKFNRLVIFNAYLPHLPNKYFGIDNEDGRLTQVIWFDIIENNKNKYINDTFINSLYPSSLNKSHKFNFCVIDNFYENPIEIREFALSQTFDISGNFPGVRTKSFLTKEIINKINNHLYQFGLNNDKLITSSGYSGSFQYNTSFEKSWVHKDHYNQWAGILYLTPDAPISSGTTFYEFYDKTANIDTLNNYSQDITKWKEVDIIGNKFNRLLLFNSHYYHMSRDYFGTDINNGRLIQLFFI